MYHNDNLIISLFTPPLGVFVFLVYCLDEFQRVGNTGREEREKEMEDTVHDSVDPGDPSG